MKVKKGDRVTFKDGSYGTVTKGTTQETGRIGVCLHSKGGELIGCISRWASDIVEIRQASISK